MALVANLQRLFLECVASIFNEELVDEQFAKVLNLRKGKPECQSIMLMAFHRDSGLHVQTLTELLADPVVNFSKVYKAAQALHGCSATIGATKIKAICSRFKELCNDHNVVMLRQCVQQLQNERAILINKLETLLRLESQIRTVGAAVPIINLKPVLRNLAEE